MGAVIHEFGPFRFDAASRVLWRADQVVTVPPKALDVLAVLLRRPGEVVGKPELLRAAWPDTVVEEANLSVNVAILRKALGAAPAGELIETLARRGYRFAGPVHTCSASAPVRALAVMPFRSLAGRGDDDALGLAIADAVITRLSGGTLSVRPTSAVQRYATGTVDLRQAIDALGVDAVVEGRLQREGDRLRVTVQVLSADGARVLAAAAFEEPMASLFALQDAVADRVAAALQVAATPAADPRRRTTSVQAYEAHARGRWFWTRISRSWLEKAVASFHEAAELDPTYAPPHAGLADVTLAGGLAGVLPPRDAWDAAEHQANRALALDDRLADGHTARAWIRLFRDWDWPGAEAEFARAAELDPRSTAVLQWRGLFEIARGQVDTAAPLLAAAHALDPLSVIASAAEGFRLDVAGHPEGAIARQRRTVELDPHQPVAHWALGIALQSGGRYGEAVEAHERALQAAEEAAFLRPILARSLALAGRSDEARRLLAAPGEGEPSRYQEAAALLALDEDAAALERLGEAAERREAFVVLMAVDPVLRALRNAPGFQALVNRIRGGR
jgi:DNA-binding winged helix-turn-helix (wHTH) protein/tetratricopeptide (TPR) repeat protein